MTSLSRHSVKRMAIVAVSAAAFCLLVTFVATDVFIDSVASTSPPKSHPRADTSRHLTARRLIVNGSLNAHNPYKNPSKETRKREKDLVLGLLPQTFNYKEDGGRHRVSEPGFGGTEPPLDVSSVEQQWQDLGQMDVNSDNEVYPRLTPIPWTDLLTSVPPQVNPKAWRVFGRRMTLAEYTLLMVIFRVFQNFASSHNLTYFICGGTLLGSYRHHDLIPWDDDIDVYMPNTSYAALKRAALDLPDKYSLYTKANRFKFFHRDSPIARKTGYGWKWPFIDINFYAEENDTIRDVAPAFRAEYVYPKDMVFPLIWRPFGPLWVPAARDPVANLHRTYNSGACQSSWYSHKYERSIGGAYILPCYLLTPFYPFVKREKTEYGWMESLYIGHRQVYSIQEPADHEPDPGAGL